MGENLWQRKKPARDATARRAGCQVATSLSASNRGKGRNRAGEKTGRKTSGTGEKAADGRFSTRGFSVPVPLPVPDFFPSSHAFSQVFPLPEHVRSRVGL